jgi:hypothetical protein
MMLDIHPLGQGMMLNEKEKKMNDIYTGLIPLKLNKNDARL